jgi:hypothetical protein
MSKYVKLLSILAQRYNVPRHLLKPFVPKQNNPYLCLAATRRDVLCPNKPLREFAGRKREVEKPGQY